MPVIFRTIFFLFFSINCFSQSGGQSLFKFLEIENSARSQALGGYSSAIFDNDVSLSLMTPSLLNQSMNNELSFNVTDYFSDIKFLSFTYAKSINKTDVLGFGIRYFDYGNFESFDQMGYVTGNFNAKDQVFSVGYSKTLNQYLILGVNVNLINSIYDTYSSNAISSNISTTYNNIENNLTASLLISNFGRQLKKYNSNNDIIECNVSISVSKILKYLPFRYHITYNYLNKFDIKSSYNLTTQTNIETGEIEVKDESLAKTFLRHIVIGGELNPFKKNFFLRGGFNFQRRFDLVTNTQPLMVGFSWGVGFRVKKIYFDYSRSSYHLSGNTNNFSIATNLTTFGI